MGLAFKIENGVVASTRFSKDVYMTATESLETGENKTTHIQTYQSLQGETKAVWSLPSNAERPQRLYIKNMTPQQIAEKRIEYANKRMLAKASAGGGGKGTTMLASSVTVCETILYEVTVNCTDYDEHNDDGTVTVCARRVTRTATICTDVPMPDYPYNPGTGSNPPPPGSNHTPVKTPCDSLKNDAALMKHAYSQDTLKSALITIAAPSSIEKGVALYEKVQVDPYDNRKISTLHYYTGEVVEGSDTNVTIPVTVSNLVALVGTVHYHPDNGYSAPSPHDIYEVIENSLYTNTSSFTKGRHLGNFVVAADGSTYAIRVTDPVKANRFFDTKSTFLDDREWKKETVIALEFDNVFKYYRRKNGYANFNKTYEETMAYLLDKYETGVTLFKKDDSGNFNPIVRKASKNPIRNKTIYINPC